MIRDSFWYANKVKKQLFPMSNQSVLLCIHLVKGGLRSFETGTYSFDSFDVLNVKCV